MQYPELMTPNEFNVCMYIVPTFVLNLFDRQSHLFLQGYKERVYMAEKGS